MKKIFTWIACTLLVMQVSAQSVVLTGKVTDTEGLPLSGASVFEKETTNGTLTDNNGNYSISLPSTATLVVKFIGFYSQEIEVNGQTEINVTLQPESVELDVVVAIGYGVQKKSDVTGSISSVNTDDIQAQAAGNAAALLQGRASGVQITQTSGEPGSGLSIRIRGTGTVNNAAPLFVVDGIFLESIEHINPSDIETIEVLKDASATAIYGSRGANGVILISTKTGKTEKVNVQIEMMHSIQNVWKTPDFLNSEDWLKIYNTSQLNAAILTGSSAYKPLTLLSPSDDPTHTTDWFDAITRTGVVDKMNVSISKGNEEANSLFSVGYFNNNGVIEYSKYQRINARLNTNYSIGEIFKTGINLSLSSSSWNDVSGSDISGPLTLAQRLDPLTPITDATTGEYLSTPYSDLRNPVAILDRDVAEGGSLLILANTYLQAEIIEGLIVKSSLSLNLSNSKSTYYYPKYEYVGGEKNLTNSLSKGTSQFYGWLSENTLSYTKQFGDHNVNVLAGFTAEKEYSESLGAARSNIPNDLEEMQYISASSDLASTTAYNSGVDTRMYSLLGRVNYNYANRYLLTASIRRDGSSVFGPGKRFGNFPSASLGWVASNETFLDFIPENIVNNLKFRFGWGRVGNAKIDPYMYTSTLQTSESVLEYSYIFNNVEVPGLASVRMANESIHWETVESTNFGLDLGLLNDKITLTADYFVKRTKEMLVQVPIPLYSGYAYIPYGNAGEVENKGFELSANYRATIANDIKINVNANISHVKNEVTDLGGGQPIWSGSAALVGTTTRTAEGYPIGAFWGYQIAGVFESANEVANSAQKTEGLGAGDFKYVDQWTDKNNDGVMEEPDGVINGDDRVMIGSPIPDVYYGLTIDASYKNFDLTMFFQGVYGNEIFNAFKYYNYDVSKKYAMAADYMNYWPENRSGKMFGLNAATAQPNKNLRVSDFYIEDGSYLRMKNLQLGYTFRNATPWMASARVYLSAQNVFTLTKYSGLDPEIGGGTLSQGVDYGTYPQARTMSIGATLTF